LFSDNISSFSDAIHDILYLGTLNLRQYTSVSKHLVQSFEVNDTCFSQDSLDHVEWRELCQSLPSEIASLVSHQTGSAEVLIDIYWGYLISVYSPAY